MSISDALTRISQIQAQMASLTQGTPPAVSPAGAGASSTVPAEASGSFAAALGQAQGSPATTSAGAAGLAAAGAGPSGGSLTYAAQLPASGYAGILPATTGLGGAAVAGAGATGGALPAAATRLLSSAQQAFASRLSTDTGLDPQVVSAWLLAEESGSAAQARQSQGNNDWLNIGYTDSGTYGSADSVWGDPVSAADATAGWLKGQNTIPGYGTASGGIQAILATAGQPPGTQIAALQSSGWASSGYPELSDLYAQLGA